MRVTASLATIICVGFLSSPCIAQITEWRPDLVAAYESDGGKNVPNYMFDGVYGTRSAGGVCQMLTSTYQPIARSIDIDVEKFPVLGTLPEFDQWRACWKLWSVRGYEPWTCCNAKLRRALNSGAQPPVRQTKETAVRTEPKTEQPKSRSEMFMARMAASSDVYSSMSNKR